MKKTTIEINNTNYNLYIGVNEVYGEFILETEGDPTCLNELEDVGTPECEELIKKINNVIASSNTYWEDLDEEDEEHISEWLNIWGIA